MIYIVYPLNGGVMEVYELEYTDDNGKKIQFEINNINTSKEDYYAQKKELLKRYNHLISISRNQTSKEILAIRNYFAHENIRYENIIIEDFKELNICFSNKAYKATLILAGSLLEAFLLDWLSEIDGKDYFKTPYMIEVKDKNGDIKLKESDLLNTYIEAIKEIKKPDWMESSKNAHFIRKQRNLVHAKLCLKSDKKIDEDICKKVISYLHEIINTRIESKRNLL